MKSVFVSIDPYRSHYIALNNILKQIQRNGYEVYCFIHDNPFLEEFVVEQGYIPLIFKISNNNYLKINFKKNTEDLIQKLILSGDSFPYNLILNRFSAEDHIKLEKKEDFKIDDIHAKLNAIFNQLLNQDNLLDETLKQFEIPKNSYSYLRTHLKDQNNIGFDKSLNTRIFNHILICELLFPAYLKKPSHYNLYRTNKFFNKIYRRIKETQWMGNIHADHGRQIIIELSKRDQFKEWINQYNPDLLLFEQNTSRFLFFFKDLGMKCLQISSICYNEQELDSPPLMTKHVPRHNLFSRYIIKILWMYANTFLMKKLLNIGNFILQKPLYKEVKEIWINQKKKYKPLITKRTMGFGTIDTPEFILNAKEFEFARKTDFRNNIHFIGPSIDLDRKEENHQWDSIEANKYLIYCSFGSVIYNNKNKVIKYINNLFKVLERNNDYTLILSLGKKIPIEELNKCPDNVHIFDWVPQTEVLKKIDLMINHGGLGTVKECILNAVPMIVYPLFGDQLGNSARIKYHKLGIRGNINWNSPKSIEKKINKILLNRFYKENICKMQSTFLKYEKEDLFSKIFSNILEENKSLNSCN